MNLWVLNAKRSSNENQSGVAIESQVLPYYPAFFISIFDLLNIKISGEGVFLDKGLQRGAFTGFLITGTGGNVQRRDFSR